jgi:hypothetical protein
MWTASQEEKRPPTFLPLNQAKQLQTAHAEACQDLRREAERPGIGSCRYLEKQRGRLGQA